MKTMKILALVSVVIWLAACEKDRASTLTVEPSVSEGTGKVVARADIIDALWGAEGELNPDAVCIANSTFTFAKENTFQIMKNTDPDEYNLSDAIIVGSLNIKTAGTDPEKNAGCPEGGAHYLVSASEDSPIDIESSEELSGRYSISANAKTSPAPFPASCAITAHFERQGGPAPSEEPVEEPPVEEEASDGTVEEPAADAGEEENLEDIPQTETVVRTLKLVVTERNCSVQ